MAEDLRPCPFVHGRKSLAIRNPEPRCWYVECGCGACGPESLTEIDAKANWNERSR